MDGLEPKKGGLAAKLPDILAFLASLGVFALAYLLFTNKIPKVYLWVNQHFYILAVIGILGFLGEKISVTLLIFFLPLLMIGSTLAFKFKPEQYAIEDWWEVYSLVVMFSAGFLVFLFFRWEQTKKLKGSEKELTARVDPHAAARFRAEQAQKEAAKDVKIGDDDGGRGKLKKKKEVVEEAVDPNETPEQRMEREMRTLKDEFSRRSMKLTTTLLRIKNLAKTLDRDEIFTNVLEIISKGMDADRVQLLLNDEQHGKLRVLRAEGMKPSDYKDLAIPHEENSIIAFLAKQTATGAGGASAMGVKECEIDPKTRGMIGQGVLKTVIAAPIYAEEKVFAVINVEKMKNPDYSRDDQNLIATTADIAGLVMKNAKLYAATMDDLVSSKKLSEEQLKKNEELKGSLSRIVSPSVAEMIMQDPANLKLGGAKCVVTVFFSDIRGFTSMSEAIGDPEALVKILNIYFTRMTDILMSLEGTLDKYVGDEMMALFGAPVSRPDDAIRAVLCAVLMIRELRKIQAEFEAEGKPVFSIGIGINTGEVTAGYMGSEKQLSYTVIGDNVNLGARLCSAAKKEEVIIAKSTYDFCSEYFDCDALEPIMVKGKSKPIEIFRVNGVKEGANIEEVIGANKDLGALSIAAAAAPPSKPASAADRRSSAAMDIGGDSTQQNIQIDNKPKIIECGNCGNENDPQTKFCSKCGMPIF